MLIAAIYSIASSGISTTKGFPRTTSSRCSLAIRRALAPHTLGASVKRCGALIASGRNKSRRRLEEQFLGAEREEVAERPRRCRLRARSLVLEHSQVLDRNPDHNLDRRRNRRPFHRSRSLLASFRALLMRLKVHYSDLAVSFTSAAGSSCAPCCRRSKPHTIEIRLAGG